MPDVMSHRPARRAILAAAAALAAGALPAPTRAQPRAPRVVVIAAASPPAVATRIDAFRGGLKDLGYVENRTLVVDYLYGDDRLERIPDLVAAALRASPDVLVSAGPSVTRAARAATGDVPIVMAFDPDPVGAGFVASLLRPGGNVTGMSSVGAEMGSKQLEMLQAMLPGVRRVAVLSNATEPGNAQALQAVARAAPVLGVELAYGDVRAAADIEPALRQAAKDGAQAVLLLSSPIVTFHAARFAELALALRMPAVFPYPDVVAAGGLMHYGVSMADLFRRAAGYVDRILRGAKPAELPVEQPSRFDLVVNLRVARQLGIAIPPAVLARATRVID